MFAAATLLLSAFSLPPGQYALISSVPVHAEFMTTDFLNNAYVINRKNQVMKYDSTGTLVGTFSEDKYGTLNSVDATSPFNVLMFYRDFATIVTTDMRLATRRLYKLSTIGINNIAAVCLSHDNFIWVYDLDAGRLKKINHNYEVIAQSRDLNQLLGTRINPDFLTEKDGLVYMNIPGMGIVMFDIYGNYYTSASNTDLGFDYLNGFQVVNQRIVYYNDGDLYIYGLASGNKERIPIPKTVNTRNVRVEKGYLFLLDSDKLHFYSQMR